MKKLNIILLIIILYAIIVNSCSSTFSFLKTGYDCNCSLMKKEDSIVYKYANGYYCTAFYRNDTVVMMNFYDSLNTKVMITTFDEKMKSKDSIIVKTHLNPNEIESQSVEYVKRNPDEIADSIKKITLQLKKKYESYFRCSRLLEFRIVIQFKIDARGNIIAAYALSSSSPYKQITSDIVEIIQTVKFSSLDSMSIEKNLISNVKYPFEFRRR